MNIKQLLQVLNQNDKVLIGNREFVVKNVPRAYESLEIKSIDVKLNTIQNIQTKLKLLLLIRLNKVWLTLNKYKCLICSKTITCINRL
jgi:hypothetical protein